MESLLLSLLCRNLLHELLKTVVFKMPFLFAIGTQKLTGLDALPFPLFSSMLLGMKFIMLPALEKLLFSLLQKTRVEKRIAAILISCTHCDVSSSGKECQRSLAFRVLPLPLILSPCSLCSLQSKDIAQLVSKHKNSKQIKVSNECTHCDASDGAAGLTFFLSCSLYLCFLRLPFFITGTLLCSL